MFFILVSVVLALAVVAAGFVFNKKALAVPVAIALPLIVIVAEAFTIVSPGHVGVQVTLGEVNPRQRQMCIRDRITRFLVLQLTKHSRQSLRNTIVKNLSLNVTR